MSVHNVIDSVCTASRTKASNPVVRLAILGILAGIFIAFAAEGSTMAAFGLLGNPATYGVGRLVAGVVFGTGLMLVVIAGGELFTGNNLMLIALAERQISVKEMLKNWTIVYASNFIGAVFIAFTMNNSNLFYAADCALGGMVIKMAFAKVSLSFWAAFYMGVMCNMLVCAAVWMCYISKNVSEKILAIFFAISLFITSGFEHSVANMYYVPAGILAKSNEALAAASGLTPEKLEGLNWMLFFANNLIPVTLGNIVGGSFIALSYWHVYKSKGPGGGSQAEN